MISHDWLVRFLEHRIGDRRIIRLIQKWLKAGVLDAGHHLETEEGTPQGAVITPPTILPNSPLISRRRSRANDYGRAIAMGSGARR